MDYQQNMLLLKVPPGNVFYKRQCWVYNFAISSGKTGDHRFYIYDETVGRKSANSPISFLYHYVYNVLDLAIEILYLFSDNCVAQNKNHALTQLLYYLIDNGSFTKIVHMFPEPGHSFMPCDRTFGMIKKRLRKTERVFLPTEYAIIVQNTCKKYSVVHMDRSMIFDFVGTLPDFFLKAPYIMKFNTKKDKYMITKYKLFIYDVETVRQGTISCSSTVGGILVAHSVKLCDTRNETSLTLEGLQPAYRGPLPLKPAKLKDVKELAQKYVC